MGNMYLLYPLKEEKRMPVYVNAAEYRDEIIESYNELNLYCKKLIAKRNALERISDELEELLLNVKDELARLSYLSKRRINF